MNRIRKIHVPFAVVVAATLVACGGEGGTTHTTSTTSTTGPAGAGGASGAGGATGAGGTMGAGGAGGAITTSTTSISTTSTSTTSTSTTSTSTTSTTTTGTGGSACTSNADCNDSNSCTVDTCQAGTCAHAQAANGTTCDDGDACTQTDTCQAGTCVGANPVVCTPQQCQDPGTCNPANGACSYPDKANGTVCNDSNLCTQTDTCEAGLCVGGNPVVCQVGSCNPSNGQCPCVPKTSCPSGYDCGTVSNDCGGTITCGACSGAQTCGGGGTANVCGTPPPVCHAGPAVHFNSGSVQGCGLPKAPGQCNTDFCWVVNGSCDYGTATGVTNVSVTGTCNGLAMSSSSPTQVDESGGNVTAYFDKEQDVCYFSGCEAALEISFNVTCCQ